MAKILKPRRRFPAGVWVWRWSGVFLFFMSQWWMFVRLDVLAQNWVLWLAVWAALACGYVSATGRARVLRAGLRGEAVVARVLDALPTTWCVLHDVLVPTGGRLRQLDHVVAGPGGVWVVETKSWLGEIEYGPGGWRRWLRGGAAPMRDPVRQACGAAAALGHELRRRGCSVWVAPAVCFVDSIPGADMPVDFGDAVVVWDPDELVGALLAGSRPVRHPLAIGGAVLDLDRAVRRRQQAGV